MASEHVLIHRDIVFAEVDDIPLKLDLYVPQTDPPAPLVVWIHGGGWRGGSKEKPLVRSVIGDGFALASISHRFTDQAIFPAQIHDCKGAIRWLRAHQQQFGYQADWIAAVGCSSGGHLAMLLGTSGGDLTLEGNIGGNTDQSSRVQCVVSYFGPSDFVLRGKTQPEIAHTEKSGSFALLGGLKNGHPLPELEEAASPALNVSRDSPPLLVFHGTDDSLVLVDQSEQIVRAYHQSGREARLILIEGAGHGGTIFYWGQHFDSLRDFLLTNRPK